MSYWPDECTRHHDTSPLPPQDNSQSSTVPPSTVIPPSIPPRPLGLGYQPVGHSRISEASNQTTSPSLISPWESAYSSNTGTGGVHYSPDPPNINTPLECNVYNQYSLAPTSGVFSAQARDYTDVTNFLAGAKIYPPPPLSFRSGGTASPRLSSDAAGRSDISIFPTVSRQGIFANDVSAGVYPGEQGEAHATQDVSVSRGYRPRSDGAESHAPSTVPRIAVVDNSSVGGSSSSNIVQQGTHSKDMTAMHETFQTMRLANSNEATPVSSGNIGTTQYSAYSSQPVSPPSVTRGDNVPFSVHKVSDAPNTYAPPTPRRKRRGPKECMSTYVTFAAVWYAHPRTPEYQICPNCYDNCIRDSRFAADFRGTLCDDGNPRICRFASPRMKDSLFESALVSGSLDNVVQYMSLRASISDCVGQIGAKGDAGVKWYRTRNNDIPAMAACQACYEDEILAYQKFGEKYFEPNTIEHPPDQTWTCHMAIPYVIREYKLRAETNDWESFIQEAPARMNLRHCPGEKAVYPSGRWFTPVDGPLGFLICVTCYCDYFLLTGQEKEWKDAENLANIFGASVSCCLGPFNIKALAARMLDTNDYALFWKAVDIIGREPACKPKMMQSATWFTLHSSPAGFAICRTCYATIAEPMGVGKYFMLKPRAPPGSAITCSFNPAIPRFPLYMSKLLEMVYKQDPAALEEFIKVYAFMPACRGANPVENARWYGWSECFICLECHYEFVRGTSLADAMPHRGVLVEGGVMCEMYSPRMRNLYLAACASDPPDPTPLLEYSLQRRAVFVETVLRARPIVSDIMLNLEKQQQKMDAAMNNGMPLYTFAGHNNNNNPWQNNSNNSLPLEQMYGNSSIGYDYNRNHMQQVKGTDAIGNEIRGSPAHVASQLEAQWRAVE